MSATDFTTHADPMDRQVSAPGGLGPIGWLRWMWRRLISMRTALVLLLLLGLAAIPGSLLPQRTSDSVAVSNYFTEHRELAPWLDRLGLFDVYGSPWFAAIYLLLFISLVGCVVPRIGVHYRTWRAGPPEPPRRRSDDPIVTGDSQVLLDTAETTLRAARWRVRRDGAHVAAEKGYLRETGNEVFHVALLGLLLAIGWGAVTGWHGNVVVRENTGFSNSVSQYDQFTAGRFVDEEAISPFTVRLDSFDVEFDRDPVQMGTPRLFDARVSVTSDGEQNTEFLSVNSPVKVADAKVYLIGHGYAPRLRITDSDGTVVFEDSVVFTQEDANYTSAGVIKAPDATPQLGFRGLFAPTAAISEEAGPHSTFPGPDNPVLFLSAFAGDLGLDDGLLVDGSVSFANAVKAVAPRGADVILDTIGAKYVAENLRALAPRGRVVTIGLLGGVKAELDLGLLLAKRATWSGSVLRARPLEEKATLAQAVTREMLPLFRRQKLRPIVDAVLPMEEIRAAHERMESNETFGKLVLRW